MMLGGIFGRRSKIFYLKLGGWGNTLSSSSPVHQHWGSSMGASATPLARRKGLQRKHRRACLAQATNRSNPYCPSPPILSQSARSCDQSSPNASADPGSRRPRQSKRTCSSGRAGVARHCAGDRERFLHCLSLSHSARPLPPAHAVPPPRPPRQDGSSHATLAPEAATKVGKTQNFED